MFLAKVTGSLVATQKVDNLRGHKLLMVEPFRLDAETRTQLVTTGRSFVAVDALGAGVGEMVLITQGSSARYTPETKELPIDTVIIGIVDRVDAEGKCVFSKNEE
jgi:ethanolamine utilization protein EutN